MAKVKVMKEFIDIHTQDRHPVGEVFEATEQRIAEIKSVSDELIQVIPEPKTEPTPKKTRKQVKTDGV